MCHCSNLWHVYNVRYSYLLTIFLHTCSLFFSHDNSLFCSQPFCKQYIYSLDLYSGDLPTRNFTPDWLNYNWLLSALPGPFIHARLQSAEPSQSSRFMRTLSRKLVYVHSHTCLTGMLVVGLFWNLFNVFVYTLTLVALALIVFAFSISFILMVFVFVVFTYC